MTLAQHQGSTQPAAHAGSPPQHLLDAITDGAAEGQYLSAIGRHIDAATHFATASSATADAILLSRADAHAVLQSLSDERARLAFSASLEYILVAARGNPTPHSTPTSSAEILMSAQDPRGQQASLRHAWRVAAIALEAESTSSAQAALHALESTMCDEHVATSPDQSQSAAASSSS